MVHTMEIDATELCYVCHVILGCFILNNFQANPPNDQSPADSVATARLASSWLSKPTLATGSARLMAKK
jgi:hypothetical protein